MPKTIRFGTLPGKKVGEMNGFEIRRMNVRDLFPADYNPREIGDRNLKGLKRSVKEFGLPHAIIINRRSGRIIGGHQRLKTLDPNKTTDVVVMDLDERREKLFNVTLNNRHIQGDFTTGLRELLDEFETYNLDDLTEDLLLDDLRADIPDFETPGEGGGLVNEGEGEPQPEPPAPPCPVDPVSKPGEVYELGRHRIICGDCTREQHVKKLLGEVRPYATITDPPYCSGGFQEAGKRTGSISTNSRVPSKLRKLPTIINDTLSTRGYQSLIRRALEFADTGLIYVFTDWRMWIPLYDVVESSGFGVRSMIVWDKIMGGLGHGWLNSHELIMHARRIKVKFDPHKSSSNILRHHRSGNDLHPTQKPVELIEDLLRTTDMADTIYDPFTGSGSTLLAADLQGRTWFGCELDRKYVDVTRIRWTEYCKTQNIDPGPGALNAPS